MENGKQENTAKEHPLYDSHNSKNRRVEKSKREKGKYGYTRPPLRLP